MKPPIDLDQLYADFIRPLGEDRGDENRLHGGDLGACDYATHLRLKGESRLPFDADTIHRFYRGHMVENYVFAAVKALEANDEWVVLRGGEVEHKGIVGHPDFHARHPHKRPAIIDVSTTANQKAPPMYSHALKTAFYADSFGVGDFCEWVFPVNFKGQVGKPNAHWFETKDFIDAIDIRVKMLQEIEFGETVPPIQPPPQMRWNGKEFEFAGGLEEWRCEKYCSAICPRNKLVTPEILAEMVPY